MTFSLGLGPLASENIPILLQTQWIKEVPNIPILLHPEKEKVPNTRRFSVIHFASHFLNK